MQLPQKLKAVGSKCCWIVDWQALETSGIWNCGITGPPRTALVGTLLLWAFDRMVKTFNTFQLDLYKPEMTFPQRELEDLPMA